MRRVINFSTMGVDMSKLFTPVIMVSITKDIVVKKMTNQFLVTYAKQNQDLAILAINRYLENRGKEVSICFTLSALNSFSLHLLM